MREVSPTIRVPRRAAVVAACGEGSIPSTSHPAVTYESISATGCVPRWPRPPT